MGVKKALYYGFNGYRVPTIPRAPRSIRKRGSRNKIAEDTKVNAFELLATIAGKLLQESESSSTSSNAATVNNQPTFGRDSIKHEQNYVDKPVKSECIHQERCEESVFVSGKVDGKSDAVLECTSKITGYNYSEKIYSDMKVVTGESRNASANIANKLERDSLDHLGDSHDINIVNFGRLPQCDGEDTGIFPVANTCSLTPTPTVTNVVRNLEFPLSKHTIPSASFSRRRNNVNLKNSDDDENFSRCFKLGTKTKTFRPPPRIGDRRIRKLLKSKYWKVAPKLKDCEASIADRGVMPVCRKRKTYHNQKIYQSDTSLKRKKLYDQNSAVTTDGGSSVESFSNLPKNNIYERKGGVSSSIMGHQASFHSRDSCVRLSIKSFRVPELYIEVPETATVGLLKRTVMEAVTAMLEGSLHVGVLVRGKKIRDDNRTLLQSGISHNGNLESLGFALEPSPAQDPLLTAEDAPFLLPCDEPQLQTRPQSTPTSDTLFSDVLPDPPVVNPFCTNMESNQDSLPSPANILTEKTVSDSRALVPVPAIGMEALAVSPINKKARGSELTQRRTRRPFSVSEVEALVQAVEELGTGRWRDVKLRAFEDANHRTYVDLKDKWKTLVHTARIAPQQRRGEPVPQQLLDRVLSAQAFWSLHHEKQHGKLHVGTLKLAEAEGEAEAEAETSGS